MLYIFFLLLMVYMDLTFELIIHIHWPCCLITPWQACRKKSLGFPAREGHSCAVNGLVRLLIVTVTPFAPYTRPSAPCDRMQQTNMLQSSWGRSAVTFSCRRIWESVRLFRHVTMNSSPPNSTSSLSERNKSQIVSRWDCSIYGELKQLSAACRL